MTAMVHYTCGLHLWTAIKAVWSLLTCVTSEHLITYQLHCITGWVLTHL